MACGTPVVAWRYGSVPEVIEDGVTGFIVESVAEAVEAGEMALPGWIAERADRCSKSGSTCRGWHGSTSTFIGRWQSGNRGVGNPFRPPLQQLAVRDRKRFLPSREFRP